MPTLGATLSTATLPVLSVSTQNVSASPLALDGANGFIAYVLSVSASVTITFANVPAAGTIIWMQILNDATLRVITFSTGFRVVGTIIGVATMGSSIMFMSDGTNLREVARTVGI